MGSGRRTRSPRDIAYGGSGDGGVVFFDALVGRLRPRAGGQGGLCHERGLRAGGQDPVGVRRRRRRRAWCSSTPGASGFDHAAGGQGGLCHERGLQPRRQDPRGRIQRRRRRRRGGAVGRGRAEAPGRPSDCGGGLCPEVSFSRDGKTLAASYNGPARAAYYLGCGLAATPRLGAFARGRGRGVGGCLPPDGRAIVAANRSGLRLWDLADGPPGVADPRPERTHGPAERLRRQPGRHWLVEASMGTASAWRLPVPDSGKVQPTSLSLEGIYIAARVINKWEIMFSRTGRRLAIVGPDGWAYGKVQERSPPNHV